MRKKLLFILIATYANAFCFAAVISPPSLSVNISCNSYGCYVACNQSTGSLTANANNGTPPYTYLWSTSATTQTINNLPAGVYTVTVYDAMGDSAGSSYSISNQNTLNGAMVAIPYTIFSCENQCTGWVRYDSYHLLGTPPYTVSVSSGTVNYSPPYPYDAAFTIENICYGSNFAVTITDALGCTGYDSSSWSGGYPGPNDFNPVLNITPTCNSMPNGSVEVTNIPTTWYWEYKLKLTTDTSTAYNPNDFSGWMDFQFSTPAFYNLLPGNYYLGIIYNYTYPADQNAPGCIDFSYCYYGCPRYIPVTVPDLGPTCSNVQGDVYIDSNTNCVKDAGETGVPNTVIEFSPGTYYGYTDAAGHYSANVPWGNYNVIQHPPSTLDPFCPASPVPISLSFTNLSDTVNFADTNAAYVAPVLIPLDVETNVGHGAAHPNSTFVYGISVHNLSNSPSGILTATLNYDTLLSFVSANPAPFSVSPGQVTWQLSSTTNFQTRYAHIYVSVPNNPLLLGDTLRASVNVQAANPETNLANNIDSTWHIITGPFDPNAKTVEQPAANFIPAMDGLFNYTIQFQNTGNDTALNVEVIDTLDSDLDVATFVPGASSHTYTVDITGQGVIHFYFNNILLPDSNIDEPNSHGFVSFQIHSKANRTHGTTINNTSNIVFDFNPPINTNTTTNTVDLTLAIQASATTICAGQSVTLAMIPELQNTPWRWRTGTCSGGLVGNGNSITVSPTVTTTYFVRDSAGTIPVGSCYRKTIIVNPLPTASITPSGPTTFCQGNSVTLTTTAAANYLWSTGATTQSINVTSGGNYSVSVTSAAGCSNSSSAIVVTVNPLPIASITPNGPTTFCAGNSVMLTAGGANNYLWSDNSTSQSISVSSSGNYLVTVTDGNNCSASTSVSVTVNSLPTASITPSSSTTFCVGDSVMLTASTAISYLWSTNATTQSINVSASGNYVVTITDGNNCSSASPVTVVTVNPNPPVPNIIQILNYLESDSASGYQWYFNNVIIPGANSQSYVPPQNGNYSVVISDVNGCTASSTSYPFFPTSTEYISVENDVFIYPNPVTDELIVQSGTMKVESVEVIDVVGGKVLESLVTRTKNQVNVNVSTLAPGIYFVKVRGENGITVRRFVKQ
jgi:uncharacterized repeat protein (TIGR01451 family)